METVMVKFEVISLNLLRGTEQNAKDALSVSIIR
jgi:hypothetical protein